MLWLLLAVTAALLFYYFFVKPLKYWKERGVTGGNPIPILGDNWKLILRWQSLSEQVMDTYNIAPGERYCGMLQGMVPTLVLRDPELIKQITVKDFDHFTDRRSFIDPETDPLAGKNLMGLKGQAWRDMRALLSPSFTGSKMRTMFVLMQDTAERFVKHFNEKNQNVLELNLKDVFTRYANDMIASVAFGVEVDSIKYPDNDFYMLGKEFTDFSRFWINLKFIGLLFFPSIFKLLKISLFSKQANAFFRLIVDKTVSLREEKSIVRPDMINLFLEAKKAAQYNSENLKNRLTDSGKRSANDKIESKSGFSNEDITAQALIFFFAGFDTISNLLCFTCYELALHPEIQSRLREEVLETFEDCDKKLTYEKILKMKYLDMIISESSRKWPVAVMVDRICTKPYTIEPITPKEQAIHLKKGEILGLPIIGIHRDPSIYPDPEKFDPERFSDENKDRINPYAYIPFGAGPRNCIGNRFALLECKVMLFHILKEFEIVPTEKTRIPIKISKKHFNLFPEGGFHLGLKRKNVLTKP